jgi:hypothetical protein
MPLPSSSSFARLRWGTVGRLTLALKVYDLWSPQRNVLLYLSDHKWVFIPTANYVSLREFFSSTLTDPTAAMCLDAPGMGKTTTPERAAADSGAIYIRFSATGIVSSALHQLRSLLEAAAVAGAVGSVGASVGRITRASASLDRGTVDGQAAERMGIKVWKLALVACMDRCREHLEENQSRSAGLYDGNGTNFDIRDENVQGLFDGARAALEGAVLGGATDRVSTTCWRKGAPVVVHFDEIQSLLPEPPNHDVSGRYPPIPSSPDKCLRYCLVWFSSALREMCLGGRIRPCITGISVDAAESFYLDSGIKLWPLAPLPYFSEKYATQVLIKFLRFDRIAELELFARGVAGCPRAVQHGLLVAKERAQAVLRGETVSAITCREYVVMAYHSWRGSGVSCFLRGNAAHLPAAEEALLCVCFPAGWHAVASTEEDVPIATISVKKLPLSWREAAHVGVLRLRVAKATATVFPPFPFLERYIRSLGQQRLATENCIDLVQRARAMPASSGAKGRGKVFEFGVALELCLPGSPLLRSILNCEQLHPLKLRPYSRSVMSLRAFALVREIGAVCAEVMVVSDSSTESKPGDILVPVVLADGTPTWLVLELKSSTQADPQYVRTGLVAFIDKIASPVMKGFPYSCYLSTLEISSKTSKLVKADAALVEFNSAISPKRVMGLVVIDEDLLACCTIRLAPILYCDKAQFSGLSDAEWYRIIFTDAHALVRIADMLHARADDTCAAPSSTRISAESLLRFEIASLRAENASLRATIASRTT